MFLVRDFRSILRVVVALLAMNGPATVASAENDLQAAIRLEAPFKLAQATTALSPPTLRFDREGLLHAAWVEKSGLQGEVKTAQIPEASGGNLALSMVQVNQVGSGPEAVHQSPGFAIGSDGAQFVTWSAANKTPGSLFASDLQLARSGEGRTFQPPVQVNDDGLAISHTFESLSVGQGGELYLAWLDGSKQGSQRGQRHVCLLTGQRHHRGEERGDRRGWPVPVAAQWWPRRRMGRCGWPGAKRLRVTCGTS